MMTLLYSTWYNISIFDKKSHPNCVDIILLAPTHAVCSPSYKNHATILKIP